MSISTRVPTVAERTSQVTALRKLWVQLSPHLADAPDELLLERLRSERVVLVTAHQEGTLVGTATLALFTTLSHGNVGHVDDVVVDAGSRGTGVGRRLMQALHTEAERLGLRHLDLTSGPFRVAANALYQGLGYERRDTNCYRLRFNP